jgi:opacity protein-like surface antigen
MLLSAATSARAQAQWQATLNISMNLAGDAEFRRGGPGGSLAYWGNRLGFELEYQHYFHFFKDKNVDIIPNNCAPGGPIPCVDLNTRARSIMGSAAVLLGSEGAKWRAYGTAGVGVIHAWIEGPGEQYDLDQNNLALNIGGGVKYALIPRVGMRSDVRYMRAFVGEGSDDAYRRDYGFLRATLGVTFGLTR